MLNDLWSVENNNMAKQKSIMYNIPYFNFLHQVHWL